MLVLEVSFDVALDNGRLPYCHVAYQDNLELFLVADAALTSIERRVHKRVDSLIMKNIFSY